MTNHRGKKHPLQKGISPEASQKLFSPNCDKQQRLTEQLKALSKTLKSKHPDFVKLSQLQQSRLTIWITQQGLRKAQYLSGYRSIDKVEQYKTKQTKDLAELIAKYHPLQDKSSKPSST
jgi:integrase/recombinase XerD